MDEALNVDPPLVSQAGLFNDFLWTPIVKLILAQIFKLLPFLAWGPLGPIVTWMVTWLAGKLFDAFKEFIDVTIIPFKNAEHQKAYDLASVTLKIIAHDHGVDSEEFRKARDENKQKLSDFVRFGA